MADISITTNGTVEGTRLMVDGKDVTKEEKIVSISMFANAPYKSQYSNETYPGGIMVSYASASEDGTVSRRSIYSEKDTSASGIGKRIESKDQVVQFIGDQADVEKSQLVGLILDHCESNNIKCPARDTLLARDIESLEDKASDLDIDIDDAKKEYYAVKASETTGDEPKYPINNCKDVKDAWKLRSHAKGLKISQETLESRIKRRARKLGCEVPGDSED